MSENKSTEQKTSSPLTKVSVIAVALFMRCDFSGNLFFFLIVEIVAKFHISAKGRVPPVMAVEDVTAILRMTEFMYMYM